MAKQFQEQCWGGVSCYVMGQSVGLWYWQNESGNSAGGGVGC